VTGIWHQFVGFFRTALETLADVFAFAGDYRWALAIVGLTIITRALLLPLAIKQIKSMRETQRLQPEIARLRQKYKSDRQRLMTEMQELYQREGVNPYASCLPMIAQAPVFMATYFAIRQLKDTVGDMPFLGAHLTDKASTTVIGWVLIAVMTLAQLVTTRQLNPGQTDQQKRVQMLMPIMFVFLFMGFPIALVLYWTTSNVFQLVQQLVMTRDMRPKGSGWRGLLGMPPAGAPKGKGKARSNGKAGTKPANRSNGKPRQPQRDEKPLVKAPVAASAAAETAGAVRSADPLASRRSLEEKRQRRRRKKKKRKR
jgi:YidC/Oxa1 family membrane protein insertase